MIELTMDPPSVVANISTSDIRTVSLTITVTNTSAAAVDASGGMTFEFPVDPGPNVAGGSDSALLLSNLSGNPAASGQPVPLVTVIAAAQTAGWTIAQQPQPPAASVMFTAQPTNAAAGTIAAGGNVAFTFGEVAADLAVGWSAITMTVQSSAGSPTSVSKPIHKDAAPLSIDSFGAHPAQLTVRSSRPDLADNQVYLTWTTTSADRCVLSWSPDTGAIVTQYENSTQVHQPNPWQDAPQNPAAQSVMATLTEETTFTLDAYGSGPFVSSSVTVKLSVPTFTAVTIPPLVSGLSPAAGRVAGGEQLTITGTGLTGATAVSFGTGNNASFTVADDTTIIAIAPPGVGPGYVDVIVATPVGLSPATLMSRYGYATAAGPMVSGVVTSSGLPAGNPAGGEQVTITGTGFTGATAISFGTAAVADGGFTVADDSTITVTAPAGTATGTGTVDVTVTTPYGTSPVSAASCYTYLSDTIPFVSAIAGRIPNGNQSYAVPLYAGDPAGGETVRITGITADTTTGIGFATAVQFGAATTTAVTPVPGSSDQIDVITPAGMPGSTVEVTITTPDGDSSPAVPAGSFTYATLNQPVTPGQPFRLIWSCYDGSGPHLSWSADVNAVVTVAPETATSPMNSGDPLPTTTGSAIAAITTESTSTAVSNSATFDLGQDQPTGGTTESIIVNVNPLTVISDFTAARPVTNPDGTQKVAFSWQILNATGFIISGGGIVPTPLPGNASSHEVTLPMPLAVTSYTLTASGFGKAAPYAKTVQVTPNAVAITYFSCSLHVGPGGQQSVTVSWQAANATEFIVITGAGSITLGVQATSASVLLPSPSPAPPSPAQYPVELVAEGYQPQYRVQPVTPVPVQIVTFTANPRSITRGGHVTLSWSAIAATGFTLLGTPYPATTREVTLSPWATTTFALIAEGYTRGTQFPSANLTVIVTKDGTDGKEALLEKQPPLPLAEPADPMPAEPPGGGQQPFIAQEERPEVGAGLRDGGSGPSPAPAPLPPPAPSPARDE
jgi:hypothetical protein